MEFDSQICTTEEQSKRLLAMGLKRETADCVMMYYDGWHIGEAEHFDFDKDPVEPAWSLHRLIKMMPTIVNPVRDLFVSNKSVEYQMSEGRTTHMFASENNVYDNIINCIEWLIGSGKFNENYLDIH